MQLYPLTIPCIVLSATLGLASSLAAQPIDYLKQVKPILMSKCSACHGALKQEADLRLDASGLLLKGSENGAVLVSGKPNDSLLLKRVSSIDADTRMPPEGEGEPLDAKQIAILTNWIQQGAKAPVEKVPADPRSHWAYQPLKKPSVPNIDTQPWMKNPIDVFIADVHQSNSLQAVPVANKHTLLRRVYLDLIGLPPTRKQLSEFVTDTSPDAWNNVVDQLLEQPQHGERWARHWMDIWRYSDWAGFGNELRYSQKNMWRWRDWIIESLNADKGYDQMVIEMLAGDELRPDDPDNLRATGFLARNWYKFDRNVWMDDAVEHTAKAFLGVTLNCCRCHDHKYDPISQREYYKFRAIFEPYDVRAQRTGTQLDADKGLIRVHDAKPAEATYLFERGDPNRAVKDEPLKPGVPAVAGNTGFAVQEVSIPLLGYYPDLQEEVTSALIDQQQQAVNSADAELVAARKQPEQATDAANAKSLHDAKLLVAEKKQLAAVAKLADIRARVIAERNKYGLDASKTEPSQLAKQAAAAERNAAIATVEHSLAVAELELLTVTRMPDKDEKKAKAASDAAKKKIEAAKKSLEVARKGAENPGESYTAIGKIHAKSSTGRRLALARWITDKRNPLTARVAVNHVWTRHFGGPLVARVDDFGLRSPKPTHAALLDYLSTYLVENNWSLRKLHRLIVTSGVYTLSSTSTDAFAKNLAVDPDNKLVWRANSQRMEAEVIRDSILALSGSLDRTSGGPEIDRKQGETNVRRSIYFQHARQRQVQFLEMFEAANPRECYQRKHTVRPQQAFALMNSSLVLAEARLLARKMTADTDDAYINTAFETVLSRDPTPGESNACIKFLTEQSTLLANTPALQPLGTTTNRVPASGDPKVRARENLVLVLFNHNDFITIR